MAGKFDNLDVMLGAFVEDSEWRQAYEIYSEVPVPGVFDFMAPNKMGFDGEAWSAFFQADLPGSVCDKFFLAPTVFRGNVSTPQMDSHGGP